MTGFFTTSTGIAVEFAAQPGLSASGFDPGFGPQIEIGSVTYRGCQIENISVRNIDKLRFLALTYLAQGDGCFAQAEIRDTERRGHIALSAD